jgi:hypothetical protein
MNVNFPNREYNKLLGILSTNMQIPLKNDTFVDSSKPRYFTFKQKIPGWRIVKMKNLSRSSYHPIIFLSYSLFKIF